MNKALLTEILNQKTSFSIKTLILKYQTLVYQHSAKVTTKTVSCIPESELKDTSLQKCNKENTQAFKLICSPQVSFSLSCITELPLSSAPSPMIRFTSWSETETTQSSGHFTKRKNPQDFTQIHSRDSWMSSSVMILPKDQLLPHFLRMNGCEERSLWASNSKSTCRRDTIKLLKMIKWKRKLLKWENRCSKMKPCKNKTAHKANRPDVDNLLSYSQKGKKSFKVWWTLKHCQRHKRR